MMRNLKFLLSNIAVILLIISALSCEKKTSEEEEKRAALKKEVMDIHDYAMAKMGTLHDMEMKLLAATDSTNEEQMTMAASKINALQKADKDMMDWMRQYKAPTKEMPFEEVEKYLSVQKEMIQKVKEDTDKSIEEAKALLEQLK